MGDQQGFARTYGVELLFDTPPRIDRQALLERMREYCGHVEALGGPERPDLLLFAHVDHPVTYADGTVPAQTFMALSDKPLAPDQLAPALEQTRDWPEARATLARCRRTMVVSDILASGLDYKTRLALFHGVLRSVLEVIAPLAIHWQPSQRLVHPAAYLAARRAERADPLYPAVNVRLFRVEQGAPGEVVMDTVGLAALGLPDLQCHCAGLQPGAVAAMLYNSAAYLFEHGDVIEDGHTIQGLSPDQRWTCQHEMALVAPEREVIDVDPGPPHAAGNRGR